MAEQDKEVRFRTLLSGLQRAIRRYDPAGAADSVQEALLRAVQHDELRRRLDAHLAGGAEPDTALCGWLATTARRHAVRSAVAQRRWHAAEADVSCPAPSAEMKLIQKEKLHLATIHARTLRPAWRLAFEIRRSGIPAAAGALMIGVNRATYDVWVHRATRCLQNALAPAAPQRRV